MTRFVSMETRDIRFPTSVGLHGSDAMNPAPDYSAAYVVITTDAGDGHEGHGFVFTTGRGNDIQTVAIGALSSGSSDATSRRRWTDWETSVVS